MKNLIEDKKKLLRDEEARMKADLALYQNLEKSLKAAEEKRKQLQEKMEEASKTLTEAATSLAAVTEKCNTLMASREFSSLEEANKSLEDARQTKEAKEESYRKAHEITRNAKESKDSAETLIRQCMDTLPGYRKTRDQRKEIYGRTMEEKCIDQTRWRELVFTYTKEDAESFRGRVEDHRQKRTAANTRKKTALTLIGKQPRPNLEQLRENMNQAEKNLSDWQKICDSVRRYRDTNEKVIRELSPRMEERGKIMEEYNRLDSLYQRLAGKVSGSRMDIETFVQRYYLERILHAANLRFQEMSGGQFILRMYELEKAGEGKNHGLDLMVYSTVTGTEREVRTLSGGESFMAALSLALGMADQIQENSAGTLPAFSAPLQSPRR